MRKTKHSKNMTIKRRLIISNILMIIIPVMISLVIALGSLMITWYWIRSVIDDNPLYNYNEKKVTKMIEEALESEKATLKLEELLKENAMNVIVYDKDGEQYEFGSLKFEYMDILLSNIATLGDEGYADLGDEGVFAQNATLNGKPYTVCLMYSMEDYGMEDDYQNMLNIRIVIVVIITIITVVLSVILTNLFLTRYVFRRINRSLDLLADGVRQLRDGNLDYRIEYEYEDEFSPVCENFNDMALRLHNSIELTKKQEQNRKELIAGISHDLRSPLTSIKAYVEGLLDGVARTTQSQREYMLMIKTKAGDIDHMVSRLFLFSKMDMGEYPYYPEKLELSQEILAYVEATGTEYRKKGLTILVEQMKPDIMIYADPIQLRSIFTNIFENSLKYKDKPEAMAKISVKSEDNQVQIIVDDNGPGVPMQALDKLFDVFYRSDPSRSNPNKGSGLGLAIIAKAIEKMGGSVHAKNIEPCGLRIVIELPHIMKE